MRKLILILTIIFNISIYAQISNFNTYIQYNNIPYALKFGTATTDRIIVPTAVNNSNFGSWTFIVRCLPTTLTSSRRLFHRVTAGATNNAVYLNGTGGNLEVLVGKTVLDAQYITNDTPLAGLNIKYFIAVTYNDSGAAGEFINIYTSKNDGPLIESTYGTATDGVGTAQADASFSPRFGNNSAPNGAWEGLIWEVIYIRGALSLSQIRSWQNGIPSSSTGIWLQVATVGGINSINDLSGNGNQGAPTGLLTVVNPWKFSRNVRKLN